MIKLILYISLAAILLGCNNTDKNESACEDLSDYDFGSCDMVLGVAWNGKDCAYFSGCEQIDKDGVDHSESFFESMEDCQEACE